jgi:hypothetical protein
MVVVQANRWWKETSLAEEAGVSGVGREPGS